MAEEAWGRWGADDQLGALNQIGPEQVAAAARLVKTGQRLSLAQPISSRMPVPPARPHVTHFMNRDGGDYAAGAKRTGGFQFADDTIILPLHSGTHIDCLCHAWYGDKLYNGTSGSAVSSSGAARLGAETLPPIVTRGVLLDFFALSGGALADGTSIGVDWVRQACTRAGVTLRSGDAVLIRTGWQETRGSNGTADFNREPGLGVSAAEFLAEAGAAVIGADNFAVEVMPFAEGTVFPVHQRLLRDYGIPLLEGLVLAPLAAAGATEFLFVAAALPIVGATGSPLTPIAVL